MDKTNGFPICFNVKPETPILGGNTREIDTGQIASLSTGLSWFRKDNVLINLKITCIISFLYIWISTVQSLYKTPILTQI